MFIIYLTNTETPFIKINIAFDYFSDRSMWPALQKFETHPHMTTRENDKKSTNGSMAGMEMLAKILRKHVTRHYVS